MSKAHPLGPLFCSGGVYEAAHENLSVVVKQALFG